MLGHADLGWHLELVRVHGHPAPRAPSPDHLLVMYLPDATQWQQAVARMRAQGHAPVPSFNPYWDRNGRTFEDPDGYRVVLQHDRWPARRAAGADPDSARGTHG